MSVSGYQVSVIRSFIHFVSHRRMLFTTTFSQKRHVQDVSLET